MLNFYSHFICQALDTVFHEKTVSKTSKLVKNTGLRLFQLSSQCFILQRNTLSRV